MIGPADLADWTYDECDRLAAWLRRHDAIHAVIAGQDAGAAAFRVALRPLVRRFARCEPLAYEELAAIAQELRRAA